MFYPRECITHTIAINIKRNKKSQHEVYEYNVEMMLMIETHMTRKQKKDDKTTYCTVSDTYRNCRLETEKSKANYRVID